MGSALAQLGQVDRGARGRAAPSASPIVGHGAFRATIVRAERAAALELRIAAETAGSGTRQASAAGEEPLAGHGREVLEFAGKDPAGARAQPGSV
jgi:hypothetical protein